MIVKKLALPIFSKLLLTVLIVTLLVNLIGIFSNNQVLVQASFVLLIPVFLTVFLMRYKKLNLALVSFLIFSLLGNISSVFITDPSFGFIPDAFYFLSFVYLILMIAPDFKFQRINKVIGSYLILVFSINLYLLYALYSFLVSIIPDDLGVNVFAIKSFVLIVLAFVALGVYLNYQTQKSIFFLSAVACFGFSLMLEYVNSYYTSSFSFLMIHRMLYIAGIYFIFRYATIEAVKSMKVKARIKQKRVVKEKQQAIAETMILN
ncbi:hypothetical protein PK35_01970 [Tamlana nanhaiensis]|uniref:YhhN-like protein n=1 Tax=Neotamlana nanhaiensis TaxID=1382798 RepID=A0A0D7W6B6_9FLAO|nr:hypothetical protein [Tamlana nanhaiensis]KJD34574.1 hypothetical protein PK35_01970 [Tamlana nanhaiensis]